LGCNLQIDKIVIHSLVMNKPSLFYFFSYGSNMFFERVRRRVPSVKVVQNHCLRAFELQFNKESIDGSVKANVMKADADTCVHGIIHSIAWNEKKYLDKAEGLGNGYDLAYFHAEVAGKKRKIGFYVASDPEYLVSGEPYAWYLNYVQWGARENQLPEAYITMLDDMASKPDPNKERRSIHDRVIKAYAPKN